MGTPIGSDLSAYHQMLSHLIGKKVEKIIVAHSEPDDTLYFSMLEPEDDIVLGLEFDGGKIVLWFYSDQEQNFGGHPEVVRYGEPLPESVSI